MDSSFGAHLINVEYLFPDVLLMFERRDRSYLCRFYSEIDPVYIGIFINFLGICTCRVSRLSPVELIESIEFIVSAHEVFGLRCILPSIRQV